MPDLVFGGNTYKNIDYVLIKKENGATATFVDASNYRNDLVCKPSVKSVYNSCYRLSVAKNLVNNTLTVVDATEEV